jgi:hypothetical protein
LQHCNQVGHMEDQCFDLHPCQNYCKKNHPVVKCSKRNIIARLKIHTEWIDPWQWSSTSNRLFMSCQRTQTRVKTHLVAEQNSHAP